MPVQTGIQGRGRGDDDCLGFLPAQEWDKGTLSEPPLRRQGSILSYPHGNWTPACAGVENGDLPYSAFWRRLLR